MNRPSRLCLVGVVSDAGDDNEGLGLFLSLNLKIPDMFDGTRETELINRDRFSL